MHEEDEDVAKVDEEAGREATEQAALAADAAVDTNGEASDPIEPANDDGTLATDADAASNGNGTVVAEDPIADPVDDAASAEEKAADPIAAEPADRDAASEVGEAQFATDAVEFASDETPEAEKAGAAGEANVQAETAQNDGTETSEAAEGEVAVDADTSADDGETVSEEGAAEVDERLLGILESVLFACGEPITFARLVEVVAGPTRAELRAALAALAERSERDRRGIRLVEVAGGWQFRTAPEHGEWVRRLFQQRPWRLTRATLETLAIVAYKQPLTRAEIEAIRGVDVDSVLASLLARKLVKIVGRKEVMGRPLLYGTTRQFLEVFGLRDLTALPGLAEVASAMPESVGAGAAAGDENTWSGDERNDEGHPPAEAAGGLGDVLTTGSGDADPERASDGEREASHDPGDPSASD